MVSTIPVTLRDTYELLATIPNLAVDAAFVEALPHLNPAQRAFVLDKLFARGHVAGLKELVGRFRGFKDDLRTMIIDRVDPLFEATRLSVASSSEDVRLSAIELIRCSGRCGMSYLLSEALKRHCTKTTNAATAALLEMTRTVVRRRTRTATPAARRSIRHDAEHLSDALGRALDAWTTHHRTEVLTAAMCLSDVMEEELFKKASQIRLHLARAMEGVLRESTDAAIAACALRALRHPELCGAAARKIAATPDRAFVEQLLDHVWITTHRANARACSRIRDLPWLREGTQMLQSLGRRRALAAARLLALSGVPSDDKVGFFSQMMHSPSDVLREAGVRWIARMESPAATEALRRAVGSDDGVVSQLAVQELFRRDPSSPVDRLRASFRPTPEAIARAIEMDFDVYWQRFDELDETQRRRAGRKLRASQPDRFARYLRGELVSNAAGNRVRALTIVRTLCLGQAFAERIYALSHDPDDKTRSLAVSMLADIEGATAVRILRQALNDPDQRVQANAVEALPPVDMEKWQEEIGRKLTADHHRVRANAVKALLGRRVREAAVALVAMLRDESPAHRMSGLWVVEQLRLTALLPSVRELAAGDPEEAVRDRAERVLTHPRMARVATLYDTPWGFEP